MPSDYKTQIPGSRVRLADLVGNITTEWFRFFYSLFTLTGSGTSSMSLVDLQVAPVAIPDTGGMVMTATATLNFPNTIAGACSDLTMTVPGAVSGDVVDLGVPNGSVPANGVFFGWVSAANTVTVRYIGPGDPASGTFRAVVTRY